MRHTGTASGLSFALALLLAASSAWAQTAGSISGRVTDASSGRPLSGAQVVVVGTGRGALSGADGAYTIAAVSPGAQTVRVDKVGYAPRTESVVVSGGQTAVNFALSAQAVSLEGVVAVGYGTQRRRDITGAVASVQVDEVRAAPAASVEQILQGRAAGVQVVQANGAPGGAISVRIRGTNSIGANSEPLYVIDGVPAFVGSVNRAVAGATNPLATLSPGDIESIQILKDASATAIYGSRGANGVVLITTKRGTRGENTVQFQSSYGTQEITKTLPLLNARQFAELHNEARVNARLAPAFTAEEIGQLGEGTNWQEEIFRSAPVQNHALTISGGDERTRYMVSGSLFDQRGVIESTGFRRLSGRLNLDREVSDRFRIGNSVAVSRTLSDVTETDVSASAGVVAGALEFSPTSPVRNPDGTYVLQNPLAVLISNPVATALEIDELNTASRLVGSVFGEYDLTDALRFRASLGGTAAFSRGTYYAPQTTLEGRANGGSAVVSAGQSGELVNENILTYRRPIREGHDLDFTGGFTVQTFRNESVAGRSRQFATDITGANNLGAGALPLAPSSGVDKWSLLSWLGRANYNLLDRYLFTITGRYDGSSKFGANNKWGFFPSAAFGWRISEESWLRDVEAIGDAKLRLSYGVTGNQEIGTFASLAQLTSGMYAYGSRLVTTYSPAGRAPNPDLKWESTRQLNAGLDLGLWDNRATLTTDFYTGTTQDLLLTIPLPRTSGYSSQLRNVGSIRNWGVELGVSTVNVEGDRFTWNSSLNLANNRNEVTDLGDGDRIFPAGTRGASTLDGGVTNILQVGQPIGTFFGYRTNGIWQTGEDYGAAGDPFAAPGEWKYVDVNEDGKIDADDRDLLGNAQPDFFGGLTNNFTLGSVTLDVVLQGSFGNEVLNASSLFLESGTTTTNELASSMGRWTPDNPSNTVPRAFINRRRRLLDQHIEDGSYLRLQTVTLGYALPGGLLPGADRARIYVGGQNLWTSTNYSGYDPEVSSYGGDPAFRGVDLGMYPRSRTLNVGVDVNF